MGEVATDKTFITADHPEANGRSPLPGERSYEIFFPLEDGSRLTVRLGKEGMNTFVGLLARMMVDDNESGVNDDDKV